MTLESVHRVVYDTMVFFQWTALPEGKHPDDDHLFNLAIYAKARYLVTWESRILKLAADQTQDALRLRQFAPNLEFITSKHLADELRKSD